MTINLEIPETKTTPHVWYNGSENSLNFSGRSFPENARKFYEPLYSWFDSHTDMFEFPLVLHFEMIYISSSSLIAVLDLLKKADKLFQKGNKINVIWTYDEDDDEMKKIGDDYSRILKLPFTFTNS